MTQRFFIIINVKFRLKNLCIEGIKFMNKLKKKLKIEICKPPMNKKCNFTLYLLLLFNKQNKL